MTVEHPTAGRFDPAAVQAQRQERARRQIVLLIFVVYALLLFEGALRKWVLPSFQRELYFVRDPFVLMIYFLALAHGFWPYRSTFIKVGIALGAATVALLPLQMFNPDYGTYPILIVLGLRNYFIYIPLAFVIAATFRQRDIDVLIRFTLYVAPFMAVLMNLQALESASAVINRGAAISEADAFQNLGVLHFMVRPHGTFTTDAAASLFATSVLAMVLAQWLEPAHRRCVRSVVLLVGIVSAGAMLGVGGSRRALMVAAIVLLAAASVMVITARGGIRLRSIVLPVILVGAFVVGWPLLQPEAFEAMTTRWMVANVQEQTAYKFGVFGRALRDFYAFAVDIMPIAPAEGYGLGMSTSASIRLGAREGTDIPFAEDGWSSHIVELGPILGVVYIAYRVALFGLMARQSVGATRASGGALPVLLFAMIGLTVLYGQITSQSTIHGYGWIFAGFTLAASNVYRGRSAG